MGILGKNNILLQCYVPFTFSTIFAHDSHLSHSMYAVMTCYYYPFTEPPNQTKQSDKYQHRVMKTKIVCSVDPRRGLRNIANRAQTVEKGARISETALCMQSMPTFTTFARGAAKIGTSDLPEAHLWLPPHDFNTHFLHRNEALRLLATSYHLSLHAGDASCSYAMWGPHCICTSPMFLPPLQALQPDCGCSTTERPGSSSIRVCKNCC